MPLARRGAALLMVVVALAISLQAAARDRSAHNAYNAPVVALYEWTGFYIGGNLGGSFGHVSSDLFATGLPSTVSSGGAMNGVLGGLQLGYNARFDRMFFGLETDFQGTSQRGSSLVTDFIPGTPDIPGTPGTPGTPAIPCVHIDGPNTPCQPGTGIPATPGTPGTAAIPGTPAVLGLVSYQNQLPWFGTVRGRLGFTPVDRWWLYVTGGLAYGDVTTTATLVANGALTALKTDGVKLGWVIGGGVETFVCDGWTVKLEYLYIDFGNVGATTLPGIAPITLVTGSSRLTDNIARVGFNYHFAPSIP